MITRPVLVLQNLTGDGPAYLATWLARAGLRFEVRDTEAGDGYPDDLGAYAGLALLGGEMSANDPLPSLRLAERLILQAVALGRPVIGHCLGGQLMARALGARVAASRAPEVGWLPIDIEPVPAAARWFGDERRPVVFQWHSEAFTLPAGAEALASSPGCPVQAFALGPHLAMQFHVEVDDEKPVRWSASRDETYLGWQRGHSSVQSGAAIRAAMAQRLPAQQRLADRIYARWAEGLPRD